MAQLVYPGPCTAVFVPSADTTAERGVPVEIPDILVPDLLSQGWTEAEPAEKPKPKGRKADPTTSPED